MEPLLPPFQMSAFTVDNHTEEPTLIQTLRTLEEAGRLPQMDWFGDFCKDQRLSPTQATFVLRYLNTLIDGQGRPWALQARYNDLLQHAIDAATIAQNESCSLIVPLLSDLFAYYPLQINGLSNFIQDFQRLLEPGLGLPHEIREQPQRLVLAQAILQANFFRSPPIQPEELEEIRSLDLTQFKHDDLTNVTLPKFWQAHVNCADLFHNILRRDPHPAIAAQQPALPQLSKQFSKTLYAESFLGNLDVVRAMLRIPTLNVNGQQDSHKLTALYVACQSRHTEIIKLLHQDPRIDINLPSSTGMTPFAKACFEGWDAGVEILMNDPHLDINQSQDSGSSPFFLACQNGHVSVVKRLLKDPRVDVTRPRRDGSTPFFTVCEKLITNMMPSDPKTLPLKPLTLAERSRYSDIMQMLLKDTRIDINSPEETGISPFYLACARGDIHMVEQLLLDPRVDINKAKVDGATPLFFASQNGYVQIVEQLLADKRIDPAKAMKTGSNPLTAACRAGRTDIVRILLADKRIDINHVREDGTTALLCACINQHREITKLLLLDPSIDVNLADVQGRTPLDIACWFGMDDVISLYLNNPLLDLSGNKQDKVIRTLLETPNSSLKAIKLLAKHIQLPTTYLEQLGQPLANDANIQQEIGLLYIHQRLLQLNSHLPAPTPASSDLIDELVYTENGDLHPIRSLRHMLLLATDPASKLQSEQWATRKGYSEYHPMFDLVPGGLRIRFSAMSQRAGLVEGLVHRLKDHGIISTRQFANRIYIVNGATYTHELVIFSEKLPALRTLFNLDAEITLDGKRTTLYQELFLSDEAKAILDTEVQHRLTTTDGTTFSLDTNYAIAATLFASVPESRAQLAAFHASLDKELSEATLNDPLALTRARATRQPEHSLPLPWIDFDLFGMHIRLPEEICQDESHGIHSILKNVIGLNSLPTLHIHPILGKRYTKQYLVPRNDILCFLDALGLGNLASTVNSSRLYVNYGEDLVLAKDDSIPRHYEYAPVLTDNPYTTISRSLQKVVFHDSKIVPHIFLRGRNQNLYIELNVIENKEDQTFIDRLTTYLGYPCSYSNDRADCYITVPAKQVVSFFRDKLQLDDPDGSLSIRDKLWATHPLITFRTIIRHNNGKLHAGDTLAWSLATLVPEVAKKIGDLAPDAKRPNDIVLPTVKIQNTYTEITIPENLFVPTPSGTCPMHEYLSILLNATPQGTCFRLDSDKMRQLLEDHLGMIRLPSRYQNKQRMRFHHIFFDPRQPVSINEAGITITQPDVKIPENLPDYNQQQMIDILREVLKNHPNADLWIGVFLHTHQMGDDGEVATAKKHIKECLPAILEKLQDAAIPHYKKTTLINEIGATCGPGFCEPGRASKLYSEYQKLVLPNSFDEVFSTLLSIIANFKESLINNIIAKDPKIPKTNTLHVFNAFYKQFHRECGLNPDVSAVDEDTDHYGNFLVTSAHKDKFLQNYKEKREELIQWVLDGVNVNRLHHSSKPNWTQSIVLYEAIQEKFESLFSSMDQDERTSSISSLLSSKRQRLTALIAEKDLEKVVAGCLKEDKGALERALQANQIPREQALVLAKELMPQVDAKGHNDLDAIVLTKDGAIELLIALGVLKSV